LVIMKLPWITGAFSVSVLEITQALEEAFDGLTDPFTGLFQKCIKELPVNISSTMIAVRLKKDLV
jgi:hypothetical protein